MRKVPFFNYPYLFKSKEKDFVNIFKDVGNLYLTNKRIIFLGKLRSYSINFSRITHAEYGAGYFQVQKTAGTNDIYFIEPEESLQCLVHNYNSI